MWVLECDGDILQNKRIWLRPGKKYLFGRTRMGTGFAIENKSISRKHLTISVADVKQGDGSLVHTRSDLTIEDQNSKIGTLLDGEQIRGQSRRLSKDEHQIKLGSYEFLFRIKWVPVVFSFSFPSKEQKKKDPLLAMRSRLEALDVKAILPYIVDKTTHVVANKRNTAKGLQALINARYIVTDAFIDALVAAATPQDQDDPESQSLLEIDFDANWPDALQFLPDPGREPHPRPTSYFAPDPSRANIFEGYIVVFCDQAQFDNLQPPIVNGGGKALIYRLEIGKTTAADVIRFAKSAAGEKGLGVFEDKSEGEGVVLVRFRAKEPYDAWAIELGNEIARKLDQRVIEQSEFLDAILVNNASVLRKQLPEEDEDTLPPSSAPPPLPPSSAPLPEAAKLSVEVSATPEDLPQSPTRLIPPPAGRTRTRRAVTSRFRGFGESDDDDDDEPVIASSAIQETTESSQVQPSQHHVRGSSSRPITTRGHGEAMDMNSQDIVVETQRQTQPRQSRKRSLPPSDDDEDENEMVDNLLPGAARMKKRRIEQEAENRRRGLTAEPPLDADVDGDEQVQNSSSKSQSQPPKSKKENKVDIIKAAKERREAEEEAARQDDESLRHALDGMDVEQMKNLAIVEDMEIQPRFEKPARVQSYGAEGSRWDERWNGRKNFKKFRRRADGVQPHRGQSLIVPLEEVQRKGFGIGEDYWLDASSSSRQKTRQDRSLRRESDGDGPSELNIEVDAQAAEVETDSQPFATARSQPHPTATASTATMTASQPASSRTVNTGHNEAEGEDADELEEMPVLQASRRTRQQQRTGTQSQSHTSTTRKRSAPASASRASAAPPKKKQRSLFVQDDEDDEESEDSEDELKFRFGRR